MNKALFAIVASISLVGIAHAQTKFGDLTTSTDPARAAAVEQEAAALKAQQASRQSQVSGHAMHHPMSHVGAHHHPQAKAKT